jgi:hypothetical protein
MLPTSTRIIVVAMFLLFGTITNSAHADEMENSCRESIEQSYKQIPEIAKRDYEAGYDFLLQVWWLNEFCDRKQVHDVVIKCAMAGIKSCKQRLDAHLWSNYCWENDKLNCCNPKRPIPEFNIVIQPACAEPLAKLSKMQAAITPASNYVPVDEFLAEARRIQAQCDVTLELARCVNKRRGDCVDPFNSAMWKKCVAAGECKDE